MNRNTPINPDPLQPVLDYHQATKHRFEAYATWPGFLDWETQPNPFRRYTGARLIPLDIIPPTEEPRNDAIITPGQTPSCAPLTAQSIAQLFYDNLALSAWKNTGESRWALRVNASSGNLHPSEGYLICGPVEGLSERPMVCHYTPEVHALEVMAEFTAPLKRYGPWCYPRLYWEAGLIGQLLYLEAEAAGLRATGIGCYFDDPMHEVLGLADSTFQDLYHFTVGGAVDDERLTTLPAYADRQAGR